jgi:hypothetical protein
MMTLHHMFFALLLVFEPGEEEWGVQAEIFIILGRCLFATRLDGIHEMCA